MAEEAAVPAGFWDRVRQIADEAVAKFAGSGFLRNASISEGGLTIKGGSLKVWHPNTEVSALYVGDLYEAGPTYRGTAVLMQDASGARIASFRTDTAFPNPIAEIYDSQGNPVLATDAISGQGIARPGLQGTFVRTKFTDFSVATTSPTFETLWDQRVTKQQPRLEVRLRASMDTAATTGEIRVLVDGVQLGSTTSEGFAIATRLFGPLAVAGTHMQEMVVEIQGRVTSGSGALRVEPIGWRGRQS